MIKLCIFDLDGTLINSLSDLAHAMNHALGSQGLPAHPVESYRMMVGSGISVLADRAAGILSPSQKERLLSDFSAYYTEHCLDDTRPYPKIPELLTELRRSGVYCAVNSNKPDGFAARIVNALFPEKPFSQIWGKRDGTERKPSPDAALAIMKTLGVSPAETMYIGDSDVDAITARNAGIIFCGVSWGFRPVEELKREGAKIIADTPADILNIVLSS